MKQIINCDMSGIPNFNFCEKLKLQSVASYFRKMNLFLSQSINVRTISGGHYQHSLHMNSNYNTFNSFIGRSKIIFLNYMENFTK